MIQLAERARRWLRWVGQRLPERKKIVLVALGLRVVFLAVFLWLGNFANYAPLRGETYHQAGVDGYLQIARTLWLTGEYALEPGGEPVSFRPPVQVGLMFIFGAWWAEGWFVVWLLWSALASAGVVWLTGRLVDELGGGEVWARAAMVLVAIHPYQIFSARVPGLVVTLTLVVLWLAVEVARWIRGGPGSNWRLGLAWGVGALTHATLLPLLVPISVVLLALRRGSAWGRVTAVGTLWLVTVGCVTPWTLRNYHQFGQWVPVSTGAGLQYWLGDYLYFRGFDNTAKAFEHMRMDFADREGLAIKIVHGGIVDPRHDAELLRLAKEQIRAEPVLIMKRALYGSVIFWATRDKSPIKTWLVGLMNLPLVVLFFAVTVGLTAWGAWSREGLAVWFFVMGIYGMFALVQAAGPYFVVVTPGVIGFGIWGLTRIWSGGWAMSPQER